MSSENLNDTTCLPTQKQFCDAASVSRRRTGWAFAALVLGLFLMLLSILFVGAQMDAAGFPQDSPWKALIFVILIPAMFTGIWLTTLAQRHPLLNCPHCSHRLENGLTSFYSIVTRRCPNCANLLFGEVQSPSTEPLEANDARLIRRLDLLSSRKQDGKIAWKKVRPWMLTGLVVLVLGGLSGSWLSEMLASQLGEIWSPFVAPLCLAPGISITLWSLVGSTRYLSESVSCPCCGGSIYARSNATAITGNCSTCGERAVSDPHPGLEPSDHESSNEKWSLTEFIKLTKQKHDRLWIGCFIGGGFAAVWLVPFLYHLSPDKEAIVSLSEMVMFFGYCCGLIICQMSGVFLWHWYSARDVRCPACHSELLQMHKLVVSSKRCYRCGTNVIASEQSHSV